MGTNWKSSVDVTDTVMCKIVAGGKLLLPQGAQLSDL